MKSRNAVTEQVNSEWNNQNKWNKEIRSHIEIDNTTNDKWLNMYKYDPMLMERTWDVPDLAQLKSQVKQTQEYDSIMQSYTEDLLLAHKVIKSGVPNQWGCRIPVKSTWNVELFNNLLQGYEDQDVTEWIKYGFPISREANFPDPYPCTVNHKGATEFPDAMTNTSRKK